MCTVCGCGEGEVTIDGSYRPVNDSHGMGLRNSGNDLHFGHGPAHAHAPGMSQERMVQSEQDILGKNDSYAAENRDWFAGRGIFSYNFV